MLTYAKNGGRIINLSRDIQKMESLNEELNKLNNHKNLFYPAIFQIIKVEIIKKDGKKIIRCYY